jgi:hypothetical protein
MQKLISKSMFKAKVLEYFCEVESSGTSLIVTYRGKATLETRKYCDNSQQTLQRLKGSVLKYSAPFAPIDDDTCNH